MMESLSLEYQDSRALGNIDHKSERFKDVSPSLGYAPAGNEIKMTAHSYCRA